MTAPKGLRGKHVPVWSLNAITQRNTRANFTVRDRSRTLDSVIRFGLSRDYGIYRFGLIKDPAGRPAGRACSCLNWNLVELIGIEPTTSGLQSPRSPS